MSNNVRSLYEQYGAHFGLSFREFRDLLHYFAEHTLHEEPLELIALDPQHGTGEDSYISDGSLVLSHSVGFEEDPLDNVEKAIRFYAQTFNIIRVGMQGTRYPWF